jgi:hypothetical protein
MSRTLTVSTDVFAAIWARRQDGEDSEEEILRRILGCQSFDKESAPNLTAKNKGGVHDTRNGVHFPRGFVAMRTYKRRQYEAVAEDGAWLRKDNGKRYPTLNQLNASIAAGAENVWNGNWKYRADDGSLRSIGTLRR